MFGMVDIAFNEDDVRAAESAWRYQTGDVSVVLRYAINDSHYFKIVTAYSHKTSSAGLGNGTARLQEAAIKRTFMQGGYIVDVPFHKDSEITFSYTAIDQVRPLFDIAETDPGSADYVARLDREIDRILNDFPSKIEVIEPQTIGLSRGRDMNEPHGPLLGEIAYLQDGPLKHPIIYTERGWSFCRTPDDIRPENVIRDDVCRWPYRNGNGPRS